MRLKIPDQFPIGPHKVKIRWSNADCEKEDAYGYFKYGPNEIVLREDLLTTDPSGGLLIETVIHEVLEAIVCHYDIEMTHQTIQTIGLAMTMFAQRIGFEDVPK